MQRHGINFIFLLALFSAGIYAVMGKDYFQNGHRRTAAFSAGLTQSKNISTDQNVLFDKVFINQEEGYDPETGIFTAPKAGLYVVQFHTLSEHKQTFWLELRQNGVFVASSYGGHSEWNAAGNSVILRLEQNDKLAISARREVQIYGRPDEIYTTFSAYQIDVDNADKAESVVNINVNL